MRGAAALQMAAEIAMHAEVHAKLRSDHAGVGAWLRLSREHEPPSTTAPATDSNGSCSDLLAWCQSEEEHRSWVRARAAAAAAGSRLAILVHGGASARAVASWLTAGGCASVSFSSRSGARRAPRGKQHAAWVAAYGACGVDRASLWLACKWALALSLHEALPVEEPIVAVTPTGSAFIPKACMATAATREDDTSALPTAPGRLPPSLLPPTGALTSREPVAHWCRHTSNAPREVIVALGQLRPRPLCSVQPGAAVAWATGGLASLDTACREAAASGAALLVAPEAFLQGYCTLLGAWKNTAALPRAEAEQLVGEIAARHRIGVIVGYIEQGRVHERTDECQAADVSRTHPVYNSAMLVDPSGHTILHRRKAQLTEEEASAGVAVGGVGDGVGCHAADGGANGVAMDRDGIDAPCTVALSWLGGERVAILICADIETPDAADAAVAAGASMLVVVACTFLDRHTPPTWMGAVSHAVRRRVDAS